MYIFKFFKSMHFGFFLSFVMVFFLLFGCQERDYKTILTASKPIILNDINDTLGYVNHYRNRSGLHSLKQNEILALAAKNHADYGAFNAVMGHDEDEAMLNFSGKTPSDRAKFVGYKNSNVSENIAYKSDFVVAIDSLYSAIYHRFGFLNLSIDEIGFAVSNGQKLSSFVFLMGNSKLNEFCKKGISDIGIGRFYSNFCFQKELKVLDKKYENWVKSRVKVVKFPENSYVTAYFSGENPDPMPECKITANPVSIEFAPERNIKMLDFEIFENQKILQNTKIITTQNDINHKFLPNQYAVFSKDVFKFNTEYRAKFSYIENNKQKFIEWKFVTKTPKNEYFDVNGGEFLGVEADKEYEIFFRPQNCNEILTNYTYKSSINTTTNVKQSGINTVLVQINGIKNSEVILKFNNQKSVTLKLLSSTPSLEKKREEYIIISMILIILSMTFFVIIWFKTRKVYKQNYLDK